MDKLDEKLIDYIYEGRWKNFPEGWNEKSVEKFAKSLTGKAGDEEGFFEVCVEKMTGKLDNPEAFCASVKDEVYKGNTYWRGKDKKDAKPVTKK